MSTYILKARCTEADWIAVSTENPIAEKVAQADRRVRFVLKGYTPACILVGAGGMGKTHIIEAAAQEQNLIRSYVRDYRDIAPLLESAAAKKALIVLEESDHLFRSERCLNLLKQATDPSGPATVSMPVAGAQKVIPLRQKIVFALNGDLSDLSRWPKSCAPHINALRSRETPIVIDGTIEERWEYTVYLAVCCDLLRLDEDGKTHIPIKVQNRAIEFFTQNLWRLDEVSPRRLKRIANTLMLHHKDGYSSGEAGLQADLKSYLRPRAGSAGAIPAAPTVFVTPRPRQFAKAA